MNANSKIGLHGLVSNLTTITADSTPDYDEWGWDTYWSCEDWITWHKALKAKYGKQEAITRWDTAWNAQSIDEHDYNWCKYNSAFAAYVVDQGLGAQSDIFASLYVGAGNVIDNTISGVTTASKIFKVLIPVTVAAVGIGAMVWGYKHFIAKK